MEQKQFKDAAAIYSTEAARLLATGRKQELAGVIAAFADKEFRSGETDLRGLLIAENVRGKVAVIAREGTSRCAFFEVSNAWERR